MHPCDVCAFAAAVTEATIKCGVGPVLGTVSEEEDLERGLGQGKEGKHIAEGEQSPQK